MNYVCEPERHVRAGTLGLLIILMVLMSSSGCINKVLANAPDDAPVAGGPVQETPLPETTPAGAVPATLPVSPLTEVTPGKSEIAAEVAPVLTPDPYPILHATRINETPQYRFIGRTPEFEKTYVLRGNATGLLVNVAEGPLFIVYTVTPQNDCYMSPDSCRGNKEKPAQRPYLTITVRDNQTREIIAQDGYGGVYSSDTGTYTFSVTSKNADGLTSSGGTEGTNTVSPGKRFIPVYREGVFHMTIEGNYLDAKIEIITGSSPDPLEAVSEKQAQGASATPTPVPQPEEWEEW